MRLPSRRLRLEIPERRIGRISVRFDAGSRSRVVLRDDRIEHQGDDDQHHIRCHLFYGAIQYRYVW